MIICSDLPYWNEEKNFFFFKHKSCTFLLIFVMQSEKK